MCFRVVLSVASGFRVYWVFVVSFGCVLWHFEMLQGVLSVSWVCLSVSSNFFVFWVFLVSFGCVFRHFEVFQSVLG